MENSAVIILVPLILMVVLVLGNEIRKNADKVISAQEKRAAELLAKFQDILSDRIGTLQQGLDDLKNQQDQSD